MWPNRLKKNVSIYVGVKIYPLISTCVNHSPGNKQFPSLCKLHVTFNMQRSDSSTRGVAQICSQQWFGTWPRRECFKVKCFLCTDSSLSVDGQSGTPACEISRRRQEKNTASAQRVLSPLEPKSLWHVAGRGANGKQIEDKLRNTWVKLSVPSIPVETLTPKLELEPQPAANYVLSPVDVLGIFLGFPEPLKDLFSPLRCDIESDLRWRSPPMSDPDRSPDKNLNWSTFYHTWANQRQLASTRTDSCLTEGRCSFELVCVWVCDKAPTHTALPHQRDGGGTEVTLFRVSVLIKASFHFAPSFKLPWPTSVFHVCLRFLPTRQSRWRKMKNTRLEPSQHRNTK